MRSAARLVPLVLVVAACSSYADPESAPTPTEDAGYGILMPVTDSAVTVDASASRFITEVISFEPGTCAGFQGSPRQMPEVVYGPPWGSPEGSLDVVSLGGGGSIVVGFGANGIVDGPGIDFVVFENPFDYGSGDRYVEPGEVAVSEDGVHWTAFPCTDTTQQEPDGGWGATRCGGMNVVVSNPYTNSISPFDVEHAGGDQYDLAEIGVTSAKYVRIRNIVASEDCPDAGEKPTKNGFDLDAIAIINAVLP
jgi:hypothetical protein